MARTAAAGIHPALNRQATARAVEETDEKLLEDIDGWDDFTPKQKEVLSVLPWFNSIADACRYVNLEPKQWHKWSNINKKLIAASRERKGARAKIARQMGADLLGLAMLALRDNLTSTELAPEKKMDAIKTVLRLNSLAGENPQQATVQNNTQTVITFAGSKSNDTADTIESYVMSSK